MTEPHDREAPLDPLSEADRPRRMRAFRVSEALRQANERQTNGARSSDPLAQVSLQDANELRLLLGGQSVVDWYRLDYESEADSRRLLALNALDWDDADDRARIESLRAYAADYLQRVLKLHVDEVVSHTAPFVQLPLMASGKLGTRRQQRNACTLLKVMHILYHLDARELRTLLPVSDFDLFESVEQSVLEVFDQLRSMGAPVIEFQWSRKTRESLLTKMLVKRATSAARVFDRLRFRLIVERRDDVIPTLRTMLRRLIPFNYVVPGQTVNTLVDPEPLHTVGPSPLAGGEDWAGDQNEFSGDDFRVLNFIADLPVRVDDLVEGVDWGEEPELERGNVVFVLVEFQIIDRATAKTNEQGEASHAEYKNRQHGRVRERMLRTPAGNKSSAKAKASPDASDSQPDDSMIGWMIQVDEPSD